MLQSFLSAEKKIRARCTLNLFSVRVVDFKVFHSIQVLHSKKTVSKVSFN